MENSPPGIQTMPSGAGPGGGVVFATVGWKEADVMDAGSGCWAASRAQPNPPVMSSTVSIAQAHFVFTRRTRV